MGVFLKAAVEAALEVPTRFPDRGATLSGPDDPFAFVPRELRTTTNRIIFNMVAISKASGLNELARFFYLWLYGVRSPEAAAGETLRDQTTYQVPFSTFDHDYYFDRTAHEARILGTRTFGSPETFANAITSNEGVAKSYRRLKDSLQDQKVGKSKPFGTFGDGYIPRSPDLYLGSASIHSFEIFLSREENVVKSGFKDHSWPRSLALGSFRIGVYYKGEVSQQKSGTLEFTATHRGLRLSDSFQFDEDGIYKFLSLLNSGEPLWFWTKEKIAEFKFPLGVSTYLSNMDFRSFEKDFVPVYNDRAQLSPGFKKLVCRKFDIISDVFSESLNPVEKVSIAL